MPSVAAPKEFFVNERRMYQNWQFAVWREFFQNSIDAGSSVINIKMEDIGNGVFQISFDDNGCGMTKEILEKVYFSLGATTKNTGSTVGGFGRARILTCFSMKNYTIHTMNNKVEGDGGQYELTEAPYRAGTIVTIQIENESFSTMENCLTEYLGMSQMDCNVYVNGKRWRDWCYRRQLARELKANDKAFANVYVNKSAANNRLIVRVSGTVMYSVSIRAKAQVVVEVNPEVAREVLTANRDGMHTKYSAVLYDFLDELATNTITALTRRFSDKSGLTKGGGLLFTRAKEKIVPKKTKNVRETTEVSRPLSRIAGAKVSLSGIEVLERVAACADGDKAEIISQEVGIISDSPEFEGNQGVNDPEIDRLFTPKTKSAPQVGDRFVTDLPDIMIKDETEIAAMRRVIDSYKPENWVIAAGQGGKTYNKGGTLYKLMMLWKIACECAIDSFLKVAPTLGSGELAGLSWGIGWVFNEDVKACCQSASGGNFLLLNPVDVDGGMEYSISSKKDRKRLMALAKHEVAHILCGYHDEEFARTLTCIDEVFEEKVAFQKMQEFILKAA